MAWKQHWNHEWKSNDFCHLQWLENIRTLKCMYLFICCSLKKTLSLKTEINIFSYRSLKKTQSFYSSTNNSTGHINEDIPNVASCKMLAKWGGAPWYPWTCILPADVTTTVTGTTALTYTADGPDVVVLPSIPSCVYVKVYRWGVLLAWWVLHLGIRTAPTTSVIFVLFHVWCLCFETLRNLSEGSAMKGFLSGIQTPCLGGQDTMYRTLRGFPLSFN